MALLIAPPAAVADSISFRLSIDGAELTLTNQGDSSAFYPSAFRLGADGRWEKLAATSPPTQLRPGESMKLAWTQSPASDKDSVLSVMQLVMVRFFDKSGVDFGQISFFRAPVTATETLSAAYSGGELLIEPPGRSTSIRSTWVIWPRVEGIGPIRRAVRFEHDRVPPARHVDWRLGDEPALRLDTGAAQPDVILIHQSDQGYAMQLVSGHQRYGREQRAAWLDAGVFFNRAAALVLAAAAGLVLVHLLLSRRRSRGK